MATSICFGDVVTLSVKTGESTTSLGFLEHKNDEFLLIVPPVKESASAKFQEAQFIVAPTRCEKPPANGTPLNYKQPFVLLTSSQFQDYSLNNKMNNKDTIGLQWRDVKGEMYVAIEKEGYTMEANVMDGDSSLDLVVVDSNRIRKEYNNKFVFYTKKSDVLGGYVSCGSKKGKPLSFSISRVPDVTTTKQFIQKQIPRRRRSTLTTDPAKADEIARANRVGSDASDGGALSPTGSVNAMSPTAAAEPAKPSEAEPAVTAPVEAPAGTPAALAATPSGSNEEARVSTASTVESAASAAESSTSTPASAHAAAEVPTATLVDLLSEVSLEEKPTTSSSVVAQLSPMLLVAETATSEAAPAPSTDATAETTKPAATPETAAPAPAAKDPSAKPAASPKSMTASAVRSQYVPPSPKKLTQQQSALTVTSEAENADEKLDSNCLGGNSCLIM